MDLKEQQHLINMMKMRAQLRPGGDMHMLSYVDVRQLALNIFSPQDWLQQTVKVWLKCVMQGARPGTVWLAEFLKWTDVLQKMVPKTDGQPVMAEPLRALLLRAGVSPTIEQELSRKTYPVYNFAHAYNTIMNTARSMQNEGAEPREVKIARLEDNAELQAAVKMYRAARETNRTRVKYEGALGDWLSHRGVGADEFARRMKEKLCVACGATEHMLFSCPEYVTNALNDTKTRGLQQGRQDYKRTILTRQQAHRHYRKTGEVVGAHAARVNTVDASRSPVPRDSSRGRTRDRYATPSVYCEGSQSDVSLGASTTSASDMDNVFSDSSGNEDGGGN